MYVRCPPMRTPSLLSCVLFVEYYIYCLERMRRWSLFLSVRISGGGALDYRMDRGVRLRVADPYPSQTKIFHPFQKTMVKLQPLQNFIGLFLSVHTP